MKTTSQKRVLLISPAYTPIPGGLSEIATLLAETLVRHRHTVSIITEKLTPQLPSLETTNGVTIERIASPKTRSAFHLIVLAVKLGLRMVRQNGRVDLCIIRSVTSQALLAGFLKSLGLIRYTTVITAETGGENDEIRALGRRPFARILVYFLNKNNFINSNNETNYQHYRELGFTEKKLTKIYNGIDIREYKESKYPTKVRNFAFLAELNREKGVRELLKAFAALNALYPDTHLYIGGYGKEEGYIRSFISKHRLQASITFSGYIEKSKKRAFFEQADCFVFPSHSEGFGLVVAEAALYKRVIISTPVADLREIFGSLITFCAIKSPTDLEQKMEQAIKTYRPGSLSYDSIISRLSIDQTVEEFIGLANARPTEIITDYSAAGKGRAGQSR